MKYKLLSLAILAIVLIMSGCVTNLEKSSKGTPLFTALKSNDTTLMVMLIDMNGAENVTGLHVDSPAIGSPDVIASGTSVPAGKEIKITDPALAGKVNISISSTVDGKKMTVLNGSF